MQRITARRLAWLGLLGGLLPVGIPEVARAADPPPAVVLHVAPTGSDAANGSAGAPLATLGAALARTSGGERIVLAAGTYPSARDDRVRMDEVVVEGAGAQATRIAGLEIYGGQRVRFRDIGFTGPVSIQGHNIRHAAQPASAITLERSDFTYAGSCIRIREGARNIAVLDSRIHDCASGIVGPGNLYRSSGILIRGNTIERMNTDGIQFGAWDDVRIEDNLIQHIVDANSVIHNDGIQLTGNSTGVAITANRILRSRSQLLLIQDAVGPLNDIAVTNNLMAGTFGVGLQSQGATRARFVNNTIWNAKDGGLWLRRGYPRDGTEVVPTDTLLVNTVARTIAVMEGAATATAAGNVVECPTYVGPVLAPGTACVTTMGFVGAVPATDPVNPSLERDDYRLRSDSPARPLGSAISLPPVDLAGVVRDGPVPGALHRSEVEPVPVLIAGVGRTSNRTDFTIDVRGPLVRPTGTATIENVYERTRAAGDVSCVRIAGNRATFGIRDTAGAEPVFREYYVEDLGAGGARFAALTTTASTPPPTDCRFALRRPGSGQLIASGRITVAAPG